VLLSGTVKSEHVAVV